MPSRGYLLCCVERTGSSFLAQTLVGTGLAGRPREYFNPAEQDKKLMLGILGESTMVDGLPRILEVGTTENGIFGVKLHWAHLRFLGMSIEGRWNEWQKMAMYDTLKPIPSESLSVQTVNDLLSPRFSDLRDHATAYRWLQSSIPDMDVIWLKRRNMVARAISHYRAKRTGIWWRSRTEREANKGAAPDFDLAEVHILNRIGAFQENLWRLFFERQEIEPYVVIYEDLVAQHESVVRGILDYLRLENSATQIPPIASARQSDDVSAEWEKRYRQWASETFGIEET